MENSIVVTGYKFVQHELKSPPQTMTYNDVKERLAQIFNGGYHCSFGNVSFNGVEKIMGYAYNYRPFLRKILVKQYDTWQEYYAPNKTKLKQNLYGRIQKMIYI